MAAVKVDPVFSALLTGNGWAAEDVDLAAVKFDILASGLRLSGEARARIDGHTESVTRPVRTRSGVSGGLDIVLGDDIYVNAPVNEAFCLESPYVLTWRDRFELMIEGRAVPVTPVMRPTYYGTVGASGTALEEIAQMCSADRLCYSLTGPSCSFWPEHLRCEYCSIGLNGNADARRRTVDDLMEVVGAAVHDGARPARHVLLGGGTPHGEDMGAGICMDLASSIKTNWNLPSYVMIAAPLRDEFIDGLLDSGVEELGINLEFWDDASWERYIPGKLQRIGKSRYLDAIAYAGTRFGRLRARSILIAGLEPRSSTIRAVGSSQSVA